ncbi:Probetacellulin [Bienertia sinuspersici]
MEYKLISEIALSALVFWYMCLILVLMTFLIPLIGICLADPHL